jgi:hypothetical protein
MAHVGNWELTVESGRVHGSEEALRIFGLEADPQPVVLSTLIAMVDPSDHGPVRRAMVRLR